MKVHGYKTRRYCSISQACCSSSRLMLSLISPSTESPLFRFLDQASVHISHVLSSSYTLNPFFFLHSIVTVLFFMLLGYFLQTLFPPSQRSFQGCMQAILVDDQPADLHAVEKGTVGAFENVSLDMCAIIDR